MNRVALLVLMTAVGSACETPERSAADPARADSAGVEIVSNGSAGKLGPLTTIETLRLGVLDGDGPEQFSEVFAMGLNEAGDIVVGNNGSGSVRVFDATGQFLVEVGGRGQGPGEVSMVNEVFATGDTVGIVDWQGGGKVALYDFDGALLETWTTRQGDGTMVQPLQATEEGWLTRVDHPDRFPRLSAGEVATVSQEIYLTDFGSTDVGLSPFMEPAIRERWGRTGRSSVPARSLASTLTAGST